MEEFRRAADNAKDMLAEGDPRAAFLEIRSFISYPANIEIPAMWRELWLIFAEIAANISGDEMAAIVMRSANDPEDDEALFNLGYQLIETGLPELAAVPLARGFERNPDDSKFLTELVAALESNAAYEEARQILLENEHKFSEQFIFRYLTIFNALMSGDIETGKRLYPDLKPGDDENESFMAARIERILHRIDLLKDVTSLDKTDLRGWHFAVTGGLLLHVARLGFSEGMYGRYAFYQDSEAIILEGLHRLKRTLELQGQKPPKLFSLPGRNNRILSYATAKFFDLEQENWPKEGTDEPGLIVLYDFTEIPPEFLPGLSPHREGQVLWSHAVCWTQQQPFATDVTTFLYQQNISPWEGNYRMNESTREMEQSPPMEGTPEELGARILEAKLPEDALSDLEELETVVKAGLKESILPEQREVQWFGLPVVSSRFI